MNAAEEIVRFWLQEVKGFFTIESIRLPKNKEIDILAIHPDGRKWHVESSVSVRMANYKKTAGELADEFAENKFEHPLAQKEVKKRLGGSYEKKFVVGRVSRDRQDIRDDLARECASRGVEVIAFETVLAEMSEVLSTHTYLNPVIKAVQLAHVFDVR